MSVLKIKLSGLTCEACQKLSTMKLEEIDGVSKVSVDKEGNAEIFSNRNITNGEIEKSLEDTPYKIERG